MNTITPTVKSLLIINIAAFVLQIIIPILVQPFLGENDFFSVQDMLGLHAVQATSFYPFQFLTYMFLHANLMHLFSNMLGLFMLGPVLEYHWGPRRFLIFYLVCGVGAGMLNSVVTYFEVDQFEQATRAVLQNLTPDTFESYLIKYMPRGSIDYDTLLEDFANNAGNPAYIQEAKYTIQQIHYYNVNLRTTIGASGAVFGVLTAFGLLFPNVSLYLFLIPVPIKAKYFVIGYGLVELFSIVQSDPGDNIAHFAHLSGMLFGFIMVKLWQKTDNSSRGF